MVEVAVQSGVDFSPKVWSMPSHEDLFSSGREKLWERGNIFISLTGRSLQYFQERFPWDQSIKQQIEKLLNVSTEPFEIAINPNDMFFGQKKGGLVSPYKKIGDYIEEMEAENEKLRKERIDAEYTILPLNNLAELTVPTVSGIESRILNTKSIRLIPTSTSLSPESFAAVQSGRGTGNIIQRLQINESFPTFWCLKVLRPISKSI